MTKAQTESQIVDFVRQQRAVKAPFEIVAGGTRRGIGAPTGALPQLAVSALTGIVNYEPEELLCTVAPATPVPELEAVLAQRGQRDALHPRVERAALLRRAVGLQRLAREVRETLAG